MRRISFVAGFGLVAFTLLLCDAASAQTAALAGQVASPDEGAMEGVLVSAKKSRLHHHPHGRHR